MTQMKQLTTRELLTKFTELLAEFGMNSQQTISFVKEHKQNQEFFELAQLTRKLNKALSTPNAEPESNIRPVTH